MSIENEKGGSSLQNLYSQCNLCARGCLANRNEKTGFCKMPAALFVSRAALHHWEEPVISGTRGSGTIFFSGCSLACVFCQNREISRGISGKEISIPRLAEIMLDLQSHGAHNINLVTPTHYVPSIKEAIILAKTAGLTLPIVYNTGTYDNVETLKMLDGLINVYLPDFKYYRISTAKAMCGAADYPEVARAAIAEMVRQTGHAKIDENGLMTRGVVARILLLPGHVAEAKLSLKYLFDTYGDSIYISLMNQYTPMKNMTAPLNRRVTHAEYGELVEYAEKIGLNNGFTQEFGTAKESFIPPFDNTGV